MPTGRTKMTGMAQMRLERLSIKRLYNKTVEGVPWFQRSLICLLFLLIIKKGDPMGRPLLLFCCFYSVTSFLFFHFTFDDVIAAIIRCRRPTLGFRLRLSLCVELLAQRMERLLDVFTGFPDAVDILCLCSGF